MDQVDIFSYGYNVSERRAGEFGIRHKIWRLSLRREILQVQASEDIAFNIRKNVWGKVNDRGHMRAHKFNWWMWQGVTK